MTRLLACLALLIATLLPAAATADQRDIDSASRSVVRVVLLGVSGDNIRLLGHGSGFAVEGDKIVTNHHVIRYAVRYNDVVAAVIPSEGDDPSVVSVIDYDSRRDLALLEIKGELRLPPLVLVSNFTSEEAEVTAVGYPGVVDRALGNRSSDKIRAQIPIKGRGFVSQQRDVRDVYSIMHSATIAGGNSGGPLLDNCGRVLGVNSSSTLSGTGEGEFFFAVANREVLSFLRKNDVSASVSDLPCRSLAEIEAEEAEREAQAKKLAEEEQAEREEKAEQEREQIEAQIQSDREDAMALAAVLLLVAAGGGALAWQTSQKEGGKKHAYIFGGIAAVAAIGAATVWLQRPGPEDVDAMLLERRAGDDDAAVANLIDKSGPIAGSLTCVLDLERSRITGSPDRDIEFDWTEQGCVNGRTQYGRDGAEWSRVFVPNSDDVVSVNRFDPDTGEYLVERYLIGLDAMDDARAKRQAYKPPSCGAVDAATRLGDMQSGVLASLPDSPNDRLFYQCEVKR
ncbi:trypsin-like peptidase domain-containing protein [Pontixanthobacter sp. CEM42]|uniref:trypsin-like peptidase domain-containing protein n=1 Tax=Pontixanthobacter sp. CEM42 TaxID=2792077 RepID=UPI001ADF30FF|nr:trypsin-like peptidase domain-containing protein [Pontixanthobacter sp. CEM42]